ncbi:polysaccharide pyruvyl transferase family protein [Akkermansiaceae bacterium]|nr:polysaccharide pyruvyl transferase family protein [Akkermansiaceae bacterium]
MKYVMITGGGLGNKGAQAMTFITVSEVRKRYPSHEIILISYNDFQLPANEKDRYKFKIESPPSMVYALYRLGGVFKSVAILGRHTHAEQERLEELYGNADILIDISGYALGTNWGLNYCLNFLNSILIAKVYGMRCFLMPQSFGPFDFRGVKGRLVEWFMKRLLRYPEVIFAREEEGFNLLTNDYGLKNVKLSCDLVLNSSREPSMSDIYVNPPQLEIPNIINGSVGIIPNMQNFKYGNKSHLLDVYEKAISSLVEESKHVYLIRHSIEDLAICHELKGRFQDVDSVIVLKGDYSCHEFTAFVENFDYLIASRFHSIVHAFKQSVPCLILGWAVKYHVLANTFGQSNYVFDVRDDVDFEAVLCRMQQIASNRNKESTQIRKKLGALQRDNVYDVIAPID